MAERAGVAAVLSAIRRLPAARPISQASNSRVWPVAVTVAVSLAVRSGTRRRRLSTPAELQRSPVRRSGQPPGPGTGWRTALASPPVVAEAQVDVVDLHFGQPAPEGEPGRVSAAAHAGPPALSSPRPTTARPRRRTAQRTRRCPRPVLRPGGRHLPSIPSFLAWTLGYWGVSTPVRAHTSRLRSPSALRARCVSTWPRLQSSNCDGARAWSSVVSAAVCSRRLVASSTREPSSAARASGSATAVSGFMPQKVLRRRDLTGPELDLRRKPAASRSPERPAGIGPRISALTTGGLASWPGYRVTGADSSTPAAAPGLS